MSRSNDPHLGAPAEAITSTGIRVVGAAATKLMAQGSALLTPPPPHDVVWAARFKVRPRRGSGSPVSALLNALTAAIRRDWDGCPTVAHDAPAHRAPNRFQGLNWDVIGDRGSWRGELVWRHPHPMLAGIPCTTHMVIDEQQSLAIITLSVAVAGGVAGARGFAGAGQARSPLVDAFRDVALLTADGFDGTPRLLEDADIDAFVRSTLLDEERRWPIAVLAPKEEGGYLVAPELVAQELFGLAPLYVIGRHAATFRLTDALGDRRLSAYWGALRVYLADFSCADRGEDHPLLMRDRVEDPVERAGLLGKLGRASAMRLLPVDGVAARRDELQRAPVATAASPRPAPDVTAAVLAQAVPDASYVHAAPMPPVREALTPVIENLSVRIGDLAETIAGLMAANVQLADEVARLRTTSAIRSTSVSGVERRLGAIEALLRPGSETETEPPTAQEAERDRVDNAETAPSLVEVVRHAGSEYGDALLILETAERGAEASPFDDADRIASILQGMAFVSRRRQDSKLDGGLRDAFRELGIDYRSRIAATTPEKLKRQYRFADARQREYECHEHIAVGSGYDPRHCLRIYFTSRALSEPRFVIGHVGRHLEVLSST